MKENGSEMRMKFSTHKQKFPSEKSTFEVKGIKFVGYVCFAALIRFCCKSDEK